MKKIILLLSVFIFVFMGCKKEKPQNDANVNYDDNVSQDNNDINDNNFDDDTPQNIDFNSDIDLDPFWYNNENNTNYIGNGYCLSLDYTQKKYYFITNDFDDIPVVAGNFEVKNDIIYLYPKSYNTKYINEIENERYERFLQILPNIKRNLKFKQVTKDNSIHYTRGIQDLRYNLSFAETKSGPEADSIIKIDGIDMVRIEQQHRRLIENARIRKGPGTQYENYIFEGKNYVEAGRDMIIEGRSVNMETNNNLTGYWYYGWVTHADKPGWDQIWCWVFGPLTEQY